VIKGNAALLNRAETSAIVFLHSSPFGTPDELVEVSGWPLPISGSDVAIMQ
jgi:hypothetical protein